MVPAVTTSAHMQWPERQTSRRANRLVQERNLRQTCGQIAVHGQFQPVGGEFQFVLRTQARNMLAFLNSIESTSPHRLQSPNACIRKAPTLNMVRDSKGMASSWPSVTPRSVFDTARDSAPASDTS
jgi:hypothetical protein